MTNSPCDSLILREREICRGEGKRLPAWKRRAYIDRWLADGMLIADPDADPPTENAPGAREDHGKRSEPGILRKAVTFGRAVVRHCRNGMRRTTDAEFAARLAICQSCDQFSGTVEKPKCRLCGCALPAKLRWASEACPVGKWGEIRDSG